MLSLQTLAATRQHFHLLCLTSWCGLLLLLCLLQQVPQGAQAVPLIAPNTNFEYRRYCSDRLSDAIRVICGGRTNSLGRKFPDSVSAGLRSALKRFAPSDGVFHNPSYTGSIHECCRRPCGYPDLKMYCADD